MKNEPARPRLSRRGAFAAAGSLILTMVVAACADDGPPRIAAPPGGGAGPRPAAATGDVVYVQSIDNTFRPERIEISRGTEVVWTNGGRTDHDIVPAEGDDWGVAEADFPPGATYSHVFTEPGEIKYFCTIHGVPHAGMIGTITVV